MQEYDIALKALLRASAASVVRQVSGESVSEWLAPEVKTSRVDLLGVTTEGHLLHVQLQSSNDSTMGLLENTQNGRNQTPRRKVCRIPILSGGAHPRPLRIGMAEYCLRIYRQHKKFPRQIVLYLGDAPLRMKSSLAGADLTFRYSLFDIRTLDGAALLASASIQGNLLAVLTRLPDRLDVVREILARIAKLEPPARGETFAQFLIISGPRKLAPAVREEAQKMPILNDILDHEVIGPALRQGLQQGRKEILQRQLEKRFGPLPNAIDTQLSALSKTQLDELALRLLDVAV